MLGGIIEGDSISIDRILIVGLGSIGKRHLQLARTLLPNADIRILRRYDFSPIPEYANGCFTKIEDAIVFAPQLAVISSPATFHMIAAHPLARVGVHLLIEKPLSAALDDVPSLLVTCRERNVVLLTGYNLRFLPSLRKFRELINEKVIGRVLSVRCEAGQYLPTWRPSEDYRQGVSARRAHGGGVLLELSHEIDYLRWIFGEVDWVEAVLSRQSTLEIDVEDTAHLILGFAPQTGGHQLIGTVNLDFVRQDNTRLCTAIGDKASLRWNGLTSVIEIFEPSKDEWIEIYNQQHQRNDSYIAEWQHMITCITESKAPLISGEDGMKVLQIIAAIRQASESGKKVKVAVAQTDQRDRA